MKSLAALRVLPFLIVSALVPAFAQTNWAVPGNFATIQAAIDSTLVSAGDRILVGRGAHAGALVTKGVEIKGTGGATINAGPVHGSGMIQGFRIMPSGSGATISHLVFAVDLAIMNAGASDVTVTQCTFTNPVQAVSAWRANRWNISHNEIVGLRTRNGGGIGILVGDYSGGVVQDNVVEQNKISGTLHVFAGDGGGYAGSGIVIYADFRYGSAGGTEISRNRVVKNNIAMSSDTPAVVDIVAVELTDSRQLTGVIKDNAIGFNDLRGTVVQIALTPPELADTNVISRNLGENRGKGLHPGLFRPISQ
jgi:hypothetical protein